MRSLPSAVFTQMKEFIDIVMKWNSALTIIKSNHISHLHPFASVKKPPATGPKMGPSVGPREYIPIYFPLRS